MSFDVHKVKVAIMRSYKFIRKNYICAIDGTGGIDTRFIQLWQATLSFVNFLRVFWKDSFLY